MLPPLVHISVRHAQPADMVLGVQFPVIATKHAVLVGSAPQALEFVPAACQGSTSHFRVKFHARIARQVTGLVSAPRAAPLNFSKHAILKWCNQRSAAS
jgi:hypothetical protein